MKYKFIQAIKTHSNQLTGSRFLPIPTTRSFRNWHKLSLYSQLLIPAYLMKVVGSRGTEVAFSVEEFLAGLDLLAFVYLHF